MSQFKFAGAASQYPLEAFATITVASTVGYVVGEAVSDGTATAKVSRIVDGTRLVVDCLKGGVTMAGTLTGVTSTTASLITSLAWGQPRTRDVDGTPTEKMVGVWSIDDRGFVMKNDPADHYEVSVAARLGLSKTQNTDTAVGPTLTYTIPVDGTYGDGDVMRFVIESNEALSFTGAPRVAIVTLGSAETVYATVNAEASSSMKLVFDYAVDETTTTAGQIVSAAYDANGAVITDIGGGAVTPNFAAVVTGILIA